MPVSTKPRKTKHSLFATEHALANASLPVQELLQSRMSKLGYQQIINSVNNNKSWYLKISDAKTHTKFNLPYKLIRRNT